MTVYKLYNIPIPKHENTAPPLKLYYQPLITSGNTPRLDYSLAFVAVVVSRMNVRSPRRSVVPVEKIAICGWSEDTLPRNIFGKLQLVLAYIINLCG